jgi:hypothetical protein
MKEVEDDGDFDGICVVDAADASRRRPSMPTPGSVTRASNSEMGVVTRVVAIVSASFMLENILSRAAVSAAVTIAIEVGSSGMVSVSSSGACRKIRMLTAKSADLATERESK